MGYFLGAHTKTFTVLSGLEAGVRCTVILMSSVYLLTESVGGETSHVTCSYDGSAMDFVRVAQALRNHPELRALGTNYAVREVLDCMCEGTMHLDLGLDTVDAVVIQRIGRRLLCIKREGGDPLSGRTLFLELNDVRARTADAIRDAKAGAADHGVAMLAGGVFSLAAVAFLGVMVYINNSRRRE